MVVFMSALQAYNNYLFQNIHINYKNDYAVALYDITRNPALFNTGSDHDYNLYRVYSGLSENGFQRTFDPAMNRTYSASYFNFKQLNKKSSLGAAVIFDLSKHYDEYGSLEKIFYDHYFSFADTTVGNTTYYGPRLWIIYNRDVSERVKTALQIDYGIERGLKDVYTECMTVFRNVNVKLGVSYLSPDGSLISGIYGRYFNRQGKYEAVDDLIDAINYTYIGYHVYRPENPRSINNKSDWATGYETGIHFRKENLLVKGFGLSSVMFLGTTENRIKTGSISKPVMVGYWVREAFRLENRLSYKIDAIRSEFGLVYNFSQCVDWAKHGQFEVNLLDYNSRSFDMGLELITNPFRVLTIKAGYYTGASDIKYNEYTADFLFDDRLEDSQFSMDVRWQINSISNFLVGYENTTAEPYFYWETSKFNIQNAYLAWDRLFVFGRVGIKFDAGIWDPRGSAKTIDHYGFGISLSR